MLGLQFPVDDEWPIRLPRVTPPWLVGTDEIEAFSVAAVLLLLLLIEMMMTMNVTVAVEENVVEIVECIAVAAAAVGCS